MCHSAGLASTKVGGGGGMNNSGGGFVLLTKHRWWLTAEGQFVYPPHPQPASPPTPLHSTVPTAVMSRSTCRYATAKMAAGVRVLLSALTMFGAARRSMVARGGPGRPLLSNAACRHAGCRGHVSENVRLKAIVFVMNGSCVFSSHLFP